MWHYDKKYAFFAADCSYSRFVLFQEIKKYSRHIECPQCRRRVALYRTGRVQAGFELCYVASHVSWAHLSPRIRAENWLIDQKE